MDIIVPSRSDTEPDLTSANFAQESIRVRLRQKSRPRIAGNLPAQVFRRFPIAGRALHSFQIRAVARLLVRICIGSLSTFGTK